MLQGPEQQQAERAAPADVRQPEPSGHPHCLIQQAPVCPGAGLRRPQEPPHSLAARQRHLCDTRDRLHRHHRHNTSVSIKSLYRYWLMLDKYCSRTGTGIVLYGIIRTILRCPCGHFLTYYSFYMNPYKLFADGTDSVQFVPKQDLAGIKIIFFKFCTGTSNL